MIPAATAADTRDAMDRADRWLVAALLLLALYYHWYRYPFSISNAGTSPTYSDTPAWISAPKYVILLITLFAYGAVRTLSRPSSALSYAERPRRLLLAFAYIALVVWGLLCSAATLDSYYIRASVIFLVPFAAALFARAPRPALLATGGSCLLWFLWISLLVQYLEAVLWLALGWLPALGYPDSVFTRFGSVWDDPNGYGLAIAFLLPFAVARYAGALRAALVLALIGALVLTQSLTGLAALIGSWILGNVMQFASTRAFVHLKRIVWALAACIGAAIIALSVDQIRDTLLAFAAIKEESISIHYGSGATFAELPARAWLGISPSGKIGESGWSNIIASPGIVFALLYVVVLARAALRLLTSARNRALAPSARACAVAGFYFLLAYAVGMINLPYDSIFPINLLAAIFIAIADADPGRAAIGTSENSRGRGNAPADAAPSAVAIGRG